MAWATTGEVLTQTGVTVSEAELAVASAVIDTYTGVDEDMPSDAISPRDRRVLRRATAWQAVWQRAKPGFLSDRETAADVSADGVDVRRESASDIVLAPLASREIKNLSWVGTRTVIVPGAQLAGDPRNFLSETSDDYHSWRPL